MVTPSGQPTERVTIAQIAQASGLSVATVSKVLNGRPDVSATSRSRVQELIASHGYHRRGSPTAGAPPIVDVVFDEFDSFWGAEITKGAMVAAQAAGLTLAVTSLAEGNERRLWFDHITSRGTRGIVLILSYLSASQKAELRARRLPLVVIDPAAGPMADMESVGATNWPGGLVATRHLIELGHERVAIIGGPLNLLSSRARLDGYRAALETAGLPVHPELVRPGNFAVDGGYEQTKALLALSHPPTAIFACNDLQAFGAIQAAQEAGARVPDDLSVVGFDDLPLSRLASPALTTVRQPVAEMASLAVRMLLDGGDGQRPPRRMELATSLVVRATTAPPARP